MKTNIIALMSYLAVVMGVKAQTSTEYYKARYSSGIYLSSADYQEGKLTLPADCQQEKSKVRMNDFLDRPYLTIIHQGKNIRSPKIAFSAFVAVKGTIFDFSIGTCSRSKS